jgi:hypothetical protein
VLGAGALAGKIAVKMRVRNAQVAAEIHHATTVWLFWFVFWHSFHEFAANLITEKMKKVKREQGENEDNLHFLHRVDLYQRRRGIRPQDGRVRERRKVKVGRSVRQ